MFIDQNWWIFALRGVLALIFAALAFWMPQSALLAMTISVRRIFLGQWRFQLGSGLQRCAISRKRALGLAAVQRHCRHTYRASSSWLFLGRHDGLGFFLWASGVLGDFHRCVEISAAVRLRQEIKGEIWFAFSGLLSIVLLALSSCGYFFSRPVESFLAAGWLLGFMRQSMVSRFCS